MGEMKNGSFRTVSLTPSLGAWLQESLEYQVWKESFWSLSRYEGDNSLNLSWGVNEYGEFAMIVSVYGGVKSTICVPVGDHRRGILDFIFGLELAVEVGRKRELKAQGKQQEEGQEVLLLGYTDINNGPGEQSGAKEAEEKESVEDLTGDAQRVTLSREEQRIIDETLMTPEEQVQECASDGFLIMEAKERWVDGVKDEPARSDFQREYDIIQPILAKHIEEDFEANLWVINEALRQPLIIDKLKRGLVKTLEGRVVRTTRDVAKSTEIVEAIRIKGARHQVLVSFSKSDANLIRKVCGNLIIED